MGTETDEIYFVKQAISALQMNNLSEALYHLLLGLNKYPRSFPLNDIIGEVYCRLGLFYRAIPYCQSVMSKKINEIEFVYNLIICYMVTNRIEKGVKFAEKALEVHNNHFEVLYQLGQIYQNCWMFQTASTYYEKSFQQNPNFTKSLVRLLRSYMDMIQLDKLSRMLKKYPNVPSYEIFNGFINFCQNLKDKKFEKEIKELQKFASKLAYTNIDTYSNNWFQKALEIIGDGNVSLGKAILKIARILGPNFYHYEVLYNEYGGDPTTNDEHYYETYVLGKILTKIDEKILFESAKHLPIYDPHRFVPSRKSSDRYALVELNDVSFEIQQNSNQILNYIEEKDYLRAVILCDIVLAKEPDFGLAIYNKGLALFHLHQYEEAASTIYHFLSLNSNDVKVIELGRQIFTKLNDSDKLKYFTDLAESAKKSETNETHYGSQLYETNTSIRSGNVTLTKRETNHVVERYELPRDIWNIAMQGYIHLIRNQTEGFPEVAYSTLPEYEPNYVEGRMAQATFHIKRGEFDKAEEVIKYVLTLKQDYLPAKIKLEELNKAKGDSKAKISLPPMEFKTYLFSEYYDYSFIFSIK